MREFAVDDVLLWLQTHAFRKRGAHGTPRGGTDGLSSRQRYRQQIMDEMDSTKAKAAGLAMPDMRAPMEA